MRTTFFYRWPRTFLQIALLWLWVAILVPVSQTAEPAPLDVDGVVKDEKGQPLAGATVFVHSAVPKVGPADCPTCYADCRKHVETGTFGEFRLPALNSGLVFKLLVVRAGYHPQFVTRVDGAKSLVDVTLKTVSTSVSPSLQVHGRLLDPQGKPVKGAVVSVRGVHLGKGTAYGSNLGIDPLAVSDGNGNFTLHATRAFESAILDVEARLFTKARFHTVTPGAKVNELKLTEGVTITGALVKDGLPLAGVEVGISDVQRGVVESMGTFSAVTSESGRFILVNVPPDRAYHFYAQMKSMGGWGFLPVRVVKAGNDGAELDLGDLATKPGHIVAGRIRLADGSPLPSGAKVYISREEARDTYEVPAEVDGSFRFTDVPAEVMKLWVRLDGYRMSLKNAGLDPLNSHYLIGIVASDRQDLLIDLESGRPFDAPVGGDQKTVRNEPLRGAETRQSQPDDILAAGRVIDAQTGQPLREFKVTEGRYDGFQQTFTWFAARKMKFTNGVFSVGFSQQPKPAGVLIEASGYLPRASGPLSGSDTNMVFSLKRGSNLAGMVKLPDGRPARNVTVYLTDMKDGVALDLDIQMQFELNRSLKSVRTDANGRFSFVPLLGAYAFYVYEKSGFGEIMMDDFAKSPVLQMQPMARVEGKLLVGSKPAANETVLLTYSSPPYLHHPRAFAPIHLSLDATTRPDGSFVFESVPPVPVSVFHMPKVKDSRLGFGPVSQTTGFILKPGETRAVTLGGQGRPVTGKFVINGHPGKLNWRQDVSSLELIVSDPPGIPSLREALSIYTAALNASQTEEERKMIKQSFLPKREAILQKTAAFYRTDAGMQHHFSKKTYALNFQQDGTFRVEDVPPGRYELRFELRGSGGDERTRGPLIATAKQEIEVAPMAGGRNDQPLDLGTITVAARGGLQQAQGNISK